MCPYTTKEKSRFIIHIGSKHQLSLDKHDALQLIQTHEQVVGADQIQHHETQGEQQEVVESQVETIYQLIDTTTNVGEQLEGDVTMEVTPGTVVMMPDTSGEFPDGQAVVMLPDITEGEVNHEQTVVMMPDGSGTGVESEQIIVSMPEDNNPENTVYQIVEYQ